MTDPEPTKDPGHLLPEDAWERIKARAEALDAEYATGATDDDPEPDEDEN